MNIEDMLIRITVCFILAFLIGFERQCRRRSIGFRTYALVSIGAFLFVTFSFHNEPADITRIAAQVVPGIGFLGAGVILKDGNNIKGLNTAATLWCCAAVGVLCASGLLLEATIGTVFILLSNIVLRFVARRMNDSLKHKEEELYTITVKCYKVNRDKIRSVISKINDSELKLINVESHTYEENKVIISAKIMILSHQNHLIEELINKINLEEGVLSLGWDKESNKSKEDIDEEI